MVSVERVSRHYGATRAVADVSFALARGRFLTILGPSGSGKTTLLRMIAGFIAPTSGEIRVNGEAVSARPPHRRSIGMVFQRLALFPHLNARDNVAYPLRMRRFDPCEIPDRTERMLRLVQLDGLGQRRIHELSGGQQQRVAIARALVFEPDLVLLDEPLAALDRKLREEMQLEFRRIQQELGVTTINVTHDQREALVMSDDVMVMDHGRLQQFAPPERTYVAPSNAFVAGFLGMTNIFPGVVLESTAGRVVVQAGRVVTPAHAADDVVLSPGTRVDCALRAEKLHVTAQPDPGHDGRVDAVVLQAIFEGDRTVYELSAEALGGALLRVIDRHPEEHVRRRPGDAVVVGWRARDVLLFPTLEPARLDAAAAL
jgi:putative spermidine/putrescine transport system ATP-binding protein